MESIGNKLKAAREKRKMSFSDVAQAARIKTQYVEAIENNEFHILIAPVYARGFIKLFAQCVQLDPAPLLRQFDALEEPAARTPTGQQLPEKKKIPAARTRRSFSARFAALIGVFHRVKLPDLKPPILPALKSVALPAKKWLALMAAVVICLIVLPVFIKHFLSPGAGIRVPPACRWIADPPEPYLNMPAPKSQDGLRIRQRSIPPVAF